jgi:Gpi18-like mannosyltransferase
MWKWGHEDMYFWRDWSLYMKVNGLTKIYDYGVDYLPAYIYFLYFHVKVQVTPENIQDNLYTLKFFTLIFDMLGALLAVWYVKDELKKTFFYFFLVFNVAYIYNTVFWGQVDAIFTFWGFAAIIAAIERKLVWSILFLLISLNFKLQALVFIPVVGLLLLPQIFSKQGIRKLVIAVCVGALLQFAILLPFIIKGKMGLVWQVVTSSVGRYPYPAIGAFNLWSWFVDDAPFTRTVKDSEHFFIGTYKQTGTFLFLTSIFFSVLPLVIHLYKKYVKGIGIQFPLEKIFLISSLVPLGFYFFNTQMHERYSHPALISLAAYTFCTRRYFPLVLGSLAYFLNMEKIMRYLAWTNYNTLIWDPKFVAGLYFLLIVWLYYLLYTKPTEGSLYIQRDL